MKKLVIGILAHVDAGKTTLSEELLYLCGEIRKIGRVDHGDAFLDTYELEKERGITIFSKQALLKTENMEVTLLDTPGHVDFSAEMERTLQVLNYAILVINGMDGVQSHTMTLWRLLERYQIPTFLFVNKMDLAGADKAALLAGLKAGLDEGCVDFTAPAAERDEAAALCSEDALERYLEDGALDGDTLTALIARRKLFPCWFGSALKLEGVAEFLRGLVAYAPRPRYGPDFAARVFKISRDNQGNRLTWMKLTGGALRVKEAKFDSKAVKSVRSRVTTINTHAPTPIAMEDFKSALRACAMAGGALEPYTLTAEDMLAVQKLRDGKYVTWAWNYGFSPPYDMRREARFPAGLVTAHLRVKQGCIQAVRFYGDFFGSGPLEELEAAMAGLPLDAQLAEALAPLHVEHYMSGITAEELARLLRG